MTIRKKLAEQSAVARNRKLDDHQVRTIKARLDSGEPFNDVHRDYPQVARTTIRRIQTGERAIR